MRRLACLIFYDFKKKNTNAKYQKKKKHQRKINARICSLFADGPSEENFEATQFCCSVQTSMTFPLVSLMKVTIVPENSEILS
jgi:hypothetical protein